MDTYKDTWIECTPDEVRVRGYYPPWVTKKIPYANIRAVRRVAMGPARGRARIWGTANPRYWASFDPGRPRKGTAFILDLGRFVRPYLTPADPDGFEDALRAHVELGPRLPGNPRGPFI